MVNPAIACAFGIAACRKYYTVKYIRLPDLLDELAVAQGEGVIDTTARNPSHGPMEIVEARYQNASTIFCTQFAPGGLHEKIGEVTLADAILDRGNLRFSDVLISRINAYGAIIMG
jgi:DNA replication protein DnaC